MRISDWSSDVCSSDLSVTYWNRGAEELYGWTKAAVAGRTATDLLQTQFPLSRAAAMETLMQTDRWEGVLVHARRDGPPATFASRSAGRRVGKEGVSTWRSRGSPYH